MLVYDTFVDSLFDSLFNDTFASEYGASYRTPKVIKSMTDGTFPQSNVSLNKTTKVMTIEVQLPGVSEDEIRLDRDDNVLTLLVNAENDKNEDVSEIQHGFDKPEECKLSWKLDPSRFDLDNIKVELKNGIMFIEVSPTEAAKPKKISGIFGSLKEPEKEKAEEKKVEEKKNE